MRRKIIEQQRQLEANDLNLDLENNKSSAMYNKDLYNGVVQTYLLLGLGAVRIYCFTVGFTRATVIKRIAKNNLQSFINTSTYDFVLFL